jgi:hypothetical protein
MDDLYYFSKSNLDLDQIARYAQELGLATTEFSVQGSRWLSVLETPERYSQWNLLTDGVPPDAFAGFEEPQMKVMQEFAPASALVISYHRPSLNNLVRFLKLLLERHNGWVGRDDGTFERRYDLKDLEELLIAERT